MGNNNPILKKEFFKILFFTFFVLAIMPNFLFADPAAPDNAVTCILCKIVLLATGPVGKAIGIIIVVSLGIMLFLGKVTWGLAFAIFIGIALLFGAENMINTITGAEDSPCAGAALDIDCATA